MPSNRDRQFTAARAESTKGSKALRTFREGLAERADRALDGITDQLDRTASLADARDDDFPGFAPTEAEAA